MTTFFYIILVQFNAFMGTVKEMIGKVETEHRGKLEQLDTMQQEQRCVGAQGECAHSMQ